MAEGMGGKIVGWVQEHPGPSIVIGAAGVVVVLWLFGAFSKPASSGDGGASNMAAAYYAAEAQQAVVGGQIQMANIQATRDTAIAGLETDAATKMTAIQANAATRINKQNTSTALAVTQSNNATAYAITDSNNQANIITDWFHSILPAELATFGMSGVQTYIPGVKGGPFIASSLFSPEMARQAGYSEAQIARMTGGY